MSSCFPYPKSGACIALNPDSFRLGLGILTSGAFFPKLLAIIVPLISLMPVQGVLVIYQSQLPWDKPFWIKHGWWSARTPRTQSRTANNWLISRKPESLATGSAIGSLKAPATWGTSVAAGRAVVVWQRLGQSEVPTVLALAPEKTRSGSQFGLTDGIDLGFDGQKLMRERERWI